MVRTRFLASGAVIGLALFFGAAAPASPANAGGTSPMTSYGCYARWWHTAWAGYCAPFTGTGSVGTEGYCMPGKGWSVKKAVRMAHGSYHYGFGAGECVVRVSKAQTWPFG